MFARNWFCLMLLILVSCTTVIIVGCSPDVDEDPKEDILISDQEPEPISEEPDPVLAEPDPVSEEPNPAVEPEPDWKDGILTIKAGRFKTGPKLFTALQQEERVLYDKRTDNFLLREDPPFFMAQEEYTFKVEVVTMLEAGMKKPATLKEIIQHYSDKGYRPLTHEEAFEFRLQFLEQRAVPLGHKMQEFSVLIDPKEYEPYKPDMFAFICGMRNYILDGSDWGPDEVGIGTWVFSAAREDDRNYHFDPHDERIYGIYSEEGALRGARFAVALK